MANLIRSRKILPLDVDAWIGAYKPIDNWTAEQWLSFQNPANGRLEDALVALHGFQRQYNIAGESTHKRMLDWLMSSTSFDKASLGNWDTWNTRLASFTHWSIPFKAHLMAQYASKLLPVEPQQYEGISNVEDQLGRYWNQVQSRISGTPDPFRRGPTNARTLWETYNTFRREFKHGALLNHSNEERWCDFQRLHLCSPAWRNVLTPLYKAWLHDLPENTYFRNTSLPQWFEKLEDNGIDPAIVVLPEFDSHDDYSIWHLSALWSEGSPQDIYNRVVYLDKVSKHLSFDVEHPYENCDATILNWVQGTCMEHADAWTLNQKLAVHGMLMAALFMGSTSIFGGYYDQFSQRRSGKCLHDILVQWLPELKAELDTVRQSMEVLGIQYLEETRNGRYNAPAKEYTLNSAKREYEHYSLVLNQVASPETALPSEETGLLFQDFHNEMLGV